MNVGVVVAIVLILVAYLIISIRIFPPHQRAVIFRLGRVLPQPKGPGIFMIFVPIDRVQRVSLAEQKLEVAARDVATRDEMSRRIGAEVVFRVLDPVKAVTESADYQRHIVELASVALSTAGRQFNADEIGEKAGAIGAAARKAMEEPASHLGIYILQVNVVEA